MVFCLWGNLVFMKIISWNICRLGSRNKIRVIKNFLCKEGPDVVMLQEIKKEMCDMHHVSSVWRIRNRKWAEPSFYGASEGVLIIWDSKLLSVLRW